ncbi:MAG: hypothetical protein OEX07_17070 [Gammaproteobacteria bacterium]|nr:hypothetical protein [Gammaproteobacteria bacterium]
MKKFTFLFTLFILLFSFNAYAKNDELYSTFKQYSEHAQTAETVLPLIQYYSDSQYQSFEIYFKHEDLKVGIDTLFSRLQFPSILTDEKMHHETITGNNGCLSVSGLTQDNKRISIYVGYVNSHRWLINHINIEYLTDNEDYLEKPICDNEVLMKKRMEAWSK